MSGVLLLDVDGPVARITLNRPAKLNAIDLEVARAFVDAVDRIGRSPDVVVLVITGAGASFSAGGDVASMAVADDREDFLGELAATMHRGLAALAALPVSVIIGAQGPVRGGAIGLLLSGDVIVAGHSLTLRASYSAVGLSPDCGLTSLLPAAIGVSRALRFIVLDETLTADQALEWGLVAEVTDDLDLAARVEQIAQGLVASGAPKAIGQARRLVRESLGISYREALDAEAAAIAAIVTGPEATSRLRGFVPREGGDS